MKRLNVLLFALLLCSSLHAQVQVDYQFQFSYDNSFQGWEEDSDGNLLGLIRPMQNHKQFEYPLGAGFVKFSPSADSIVWFTPFSITSEISIGFDFIELDSYIVVSQLWHGCDFGGNIIQFHALDKITGAILSSFENYDNLYSYAEDMQLVPSSVGAFRLETDRYVLDFDSDFHIVDHAEKIAPIERLVSNASMDSLFYTSYSLRLKSANNLDTSIVLTNKVLDIQPFSMGRWLVLDELGISLYATDLTLEKDIALNGIKDWSGMSFVHDELWAFVEQSNPQAICLDTINFKIQRSIDFDSDYQVNDAIYQETDNTVWLSGGYLLHENQRFFMHKTDFQNPTFSTENIDIELLDIFWKNSPIHSTSICSAFPITYAQFDSIFIEVQNNGSETISNFTVNGLFGNICTVCAHDDRATRYPIQTSISAGQSKIIFLEDYLKIPKLGNNPLCFWVAAPNNRLDDDTQNDRLCMPYSTISPTQNIDNAAKFTIQNPSNGTLNIRLESEIRASDTYSIAIFDAYGKRINSYEFMGHSDLNSFVDLTSGLYFYQISAAGKVLEYGKWVVVR